MIEAEALAAGDGPGALGREQLLDDTGNIAVPGLASDRCWPELVARSWSSALVAVDASAT